MVGRHSDRRRLQIARLRAGRAPLWRRPASCWNHAALTASWWFQVPVPSSAFAVAPGFLSASFERLDGVHVPAPTTNLELERGTAGLNYNVAAMSEPVLEL